MVDISHGRRKKLAAITLVQLDLLIFVWAGAFLAVYFIFFSRLINLQKYHIYISLPIFIIFLFSFANGIRGPKTWFYILPDAIRLEGLCVAMTIKHAQNDLVIVDDFASLPSDDAQYMHELADSRNWGYSVLFINDSSEVNKLTSFFFLNFKCQLI